jgi:hypothetical protein
MFGAVELVASFADFPIVDRWQAFGLLVVIGALLFSLTFGLARSQVLGVTAVAGLAVVMTLHFAGLPLLAGSPRAPAEVLHEKPASSDRDDPEVKAKSVSIARDAVTTLSAVDLRWVVSRPGLVEGRDDDGVLRISFTVNGPVTKMIVCADELAITYRDGWVGRFDHLTGKQLAHYRYGWGGSYDVACGDDRLWLGKPDAKAIVSVDAETLESPRITVVGMRPSSVSFGDHTVWATDERSGDVIGISADADRHVVAQFRGLGDPMRVVVADNGTPWVLHGELSCLIRVDVAQQREVGPGVALGPDPTDVALRDGVFHVVDGSDGSLRQINARTGKQEAPAVTLGQRLVGVDEHAGVVHAIDADGHLLIAGIDVLTKGPRAKSVARRAGCPAQAG